MDEKKEILKSEAESVNISLSSSSLPAHPSSLKKKKRVFPPNSEERNAEVTRLHIFLEKQKRIYEEYGFYLCIVPRTKEEREGRDRYNKDVQRAYRRAHKDKIKEYRHEYWERVQKRKFESKLQAEGREKEWQEKKKRLERLKRLGKHEQEIFEKYGFHLGYAPKTREEAEGRKRYYRDRQKIYREKNAETIAAYREQRNARAREINRQRFEEKMKALEAVDPELAAKKRRIYENASRLNSMSHEERVRYRQQKLFDKLKAQAEREEARRVAREKREAERKAKSEMSRKANRERLRLMVKEQKRKRELERIEAKKREKARKAEEWWQICKEAKERREAESALEERYRVEREENIQRYLELKRMNLERRSPGGDTQNLANTNVPTTPAGAGYGTIGVCQGSCQKEEVTNA